MSLIVNATRATSSQIDVSWSSPYSYFADTSKSYIINYVINDDVETLMVSNSRTRQQEWIVFLHSNGVSVGRVRFDASQLTLYHRAATVTVNGCDEGRHLVADERYTADGFRVKRREMAAIGEADELVAMMARMNATENSQDEQIPVVVLKNVPFDESRCTVSVHIRRDTYIRATARWMYYGLNPDKWLVIIDNLTKQTNSFSFLRHQSSIFYLVDWRASQLDFPHTLNLTPGNEYRVTVKGLKLSSQLSARCQLDAASAVPLGDSYRTVGNAETTFHATLTIEDINNLHRKALAQSWLHAPCKVLYRNKSPEYFDAMFNDDCGIMKVYVKDPSGDQASPINGRIDGLFFMAEVEQGSQTGEPVRVSPFGSRRLVVPIEVMFELAQNLYFVDWYCMRGRFHYVTLVLAKRGSATDEFCASNLLPLDIDDHTNNKFLFRDVDGQMKVACGVKVEVLFTENVKVAELISARRADIVHYVPTVGKGSSTKGGLAKRSGCPLCNLYPAISVYDEAVCI